jgi:hypothetical protein
MPWEWDRYEDEADESKGAKYMVGGRHDGSRDQEDDFI